MMMEKNEQDQIRAILVQAIANICRKGLTYHKNFSIEGLLGITLDDEEIFLLNIKETIHHSGYLIASARNNKINVTTATPSPSQAAETPKPIGSLRSRRKRSLVATSSPTSTHNTVSTITVMPATRRWRCSSGVTSPCTGETAEPSPKKVASTFPGELSPVMKSEDDSAVEEDGEEEGEQHQQEEEQEEAGDRSPVAGGTNSGLSNGKGGAGPGHSLVIRPVKKRPLWGRSRRSKPRKSVPVRAVPTTGQSMPVFPEQDTPDLRHFLSMKPMLRDIDEAESNRDDESNQSGASLHIDTGSSDREGGPVGDGGGGGVGVPQVYIDHCVDGELTDALNLTSGDGDTEEGVDLGSGSGPGGAHLVVNGAGGDAFQCGICEELFGDQSSCRRHMRHQHKAKVSYTCELCGRRFWHHGDYTEHKAVFHEGPGGYPCAHCGKVLLSKRGLKEHTQHHTGEFPYFCIHCNRGFGRKFEFTGHMRKHHPGDHGTIDSTLDSTQE